MVDDQEELVPMTPLRPLGKKPPPDGPEPRVTISTTCTGADLDVRKKGTAVQLAISLEAAAIGLQRTWLVSAAMCITAGNEAMGGTAAQICQFA